MNTSPQSSFDEVDTFTSSCGCKGDDFGGVMTEMADAMDADYGHALGQHPSPPSTPRVVPPLDEAAERDVAALVARRRWIGQQLRYYYSRMLVQYQAGARMLLRGETVYWSDLVEGGERTQPFCPEAQLAFPVAGR